MLIKDPKRAARLLVSLADARDGPLRANTSRLQPYNYSCRLGLHFKASLALHFATKAGGLLHVKAFRGGSTLPDQSRHLAHSSAIIERFAAAEACKLVRLQFNSQ